MRPIACAEQMTRWAQLAALAWPGAAAAVLLHVGAGCQYSTTSDATAAFKAAIAAAKTNAGADTIAVVSGTYAITDSLIIDDSAALTIEGGYANCSATAVASEQPTLDADTKATAGAVIQHFGAGALTLQNLRIANNDNSGHIGGAVYAVGTGALSLQNVEFDHNKASNGAGIHVEG